MAQDYGASLEAWHHWSVTLGLAEHLLPVVANPNAEISPDSNMKALGKTPSRYNFRGQAAGFAKWTEQRSTLREIGKWELEPDYGICVQSREGGLRAIDIDIPSEKKARRVLNAIEGALPLYFFPRRYREGTGKVLLPFRFEGLLTKRVLQVEGGIIEILGDGQQWIADSSYIKDGKAEGRYLWAGGWPKSLEDVPLLDERELNEMCATLEMLFAEGEDGWSIARQRREGTGVDTSPRPGGDEVENWLLANWDVRDEGRGGELYIRCPFDAEHTSDSGPTETQYAPAGTGGYERGHFKCLHAHCMKRTDEDFLEALGWSPDLSDAPELPAEPATGKEIEKSEKPEPRYIADNKGRKESRAYNHRLFLSDPENTGWRIAWDDFSAQMVFCPAGDEPGRERWTAFSDEHYVRIVEHMDRHGFVVQAASTIRPAVNAHAMRERVDLAIEWANRLPEWDGVERIETFWADYAKAEDTPYVRAVGLYSWTAQAGRVLDPGCQADMAPILVSEQGKRKTSFIAAIAPSRDMFAEINLMDRDDDTTRKMRGKLVAELGELRGMHARDKEDVKAFITRREEEWVPKYKEFGTRFKRRFLFYGTTNKDEILSDDTGERRWLPFRVGSDMQLDVEAVERDRLQLWAEAVMLWRKSGVLWRDAERLAEAEHGKFKEQDAWTSSVVSWLLRPGALTDAEKAPVDMAYEWGTDDVLVGALGFKENQIRRAEQIRVGAILTSLGCWKKRVWLRGNLYRAFREKLVANPASDGEMFE